VKQYNHKLHEHAQVKERKEKSITYLSETGITPGEMNMSVDSSCLPISQGNPQAHESVMFPREHNDIEQKIHNRERMLSELQKLVSNAETISSAINEIEELVKAIRYQTLEIVESIHQWQQKHRHHPTVVIPYMFYGSNYLLKLVSDLDFLDEHDEIVERFCFEFSGNPLAYRDGGNLKFSDEFQSKLNEISSLYENYLNEDSNDGLDGKRLRDAERIISQEIARKQTQPGNANLDQVRLEPSIGSEDDLRIGFVDSVDYDGSIFSSNKDKASASEMKQVSWATKEKSNLSQRIPTRRKPQRIKQLKEEIEGLQAMKVSLRLSQSEGRLDS
jgi:hypothetical protein